MTLAGRYFLARSARFVPAQAEIDDSGMMRVADAGGERLAEAALREARISSRLATLPRRFTLPDGSSFETEDNDGVDRLLEQHGASSRSSWIHRLERSWQWAAAGILIAALSAVLFVTHGIPTLALWLAHNTPDRVTEIASQQTLRTLDGTFLDASKLTPEEQRRIQALFRTIAGTGARGGSAYRLLLRSSPAIGANALSLPDGTIVLTDELWKLSRNTGEVQGVLAHEIAHVDARHSLQSLYQAALIPAAIAVLTGDPSQIGQLASLLPGLVVQAAYSRELERDADMRAAVMLRRVGVDPARLADILLRLEAETCVKGTCAPSWLASHPGSAERAGRLRFEATGRTEAR